MFSRNYFAYLFKRYYKSLLVYLVLGFLIYPMSMLFASVDSVGIILEVNGLSQKFYYTRYTSTMLYMGTIFMLVSFYLAPLFVRFSIITRAKADVYFSLPLTKKKIYFTSSMFALLAVLSVSSVTFLLSLATSALKRIPLHYEMEFPFFASIIAFGLAAFCISSYFCSLANNKADAIVLCVLSAAIPLLLGWSFYLIMERYINSDVLSKTVSPFSPIIGANFITTYFEEKAVAYSDDLIAAYNVNRKGTESGIYYVPDLEAGLYGTFSESCALSLEVLPVYLVFAYLSFHISKKKKAESQEEISSSPYSFPSLLPIIAFLVFFIASRMFGRDGSYTYSFMLSGSFLITIIALSVLYFCSVFIYRRKIQIDRYLIFTYIGSLASSLLLAYFLP
jgi:hypothetical protein